jgi:hypothetical protein
MEETADRPQPIDLARILRGHRNEWVALGATMKVVASGATFKEAAQKAKKAGCSAPTVIWAPSSLEGFQL